MPKRPIRERLLQLRRHCSAETCMHLSLLIQARFLDSDAYRQAGCLGLYSAYLNEVQTELVAQRCRADGKRLIYPRIAGGGLELVEVSAMEELAPGAYGIPEPTGTQLVDCDQLDLLVIPGVAFDLAGHRLGYGKGYYDRLLAVCPERVERVGFAYEFQLVDHLPVAVHDRRLTQLVTEQRLLSFPLDGQVLH